MAKMSCILSHRGVQLILAYSWAKPASTVAGKSRGGMFLLLLFLHFHCCSFLFSVPLFDLLCYIFSITKTSLFKYIGNFTPKQTENFHIKKL